MVSDWYIHGWISCLPVNFRSHHYKSFYKEVYAVFTNPDLGALKTSSTPLQSTTHDQLLQSSAIIGMGVALSVVVILMIVLATITTIAIILHRFKHSR